MRFERRHYRRWSISPSAMRRQRMRGLLAIILLNKSEKHCASVHSADIIFQAVTGQIIR
jgi:hypothetical protein